MKNAFSHTICQEQLNLGFSGLIVSDFCAFTTPPIPFSCAAHKNMIWLKLKLDYLY